MILLFGEKLSYLRRINNISQEELGNALGYTKNAISGWETSRTEPPIHIILEIAKYFNVTTDYLLGFTKEDLDNIKILKTALENAGVNNIDQAMQIIEILKNEKDAKK